MSKSRYYYYINIEPAKELLYQYRTCKGIIISISNLQRNYYVYRYQTCKGIIISISNLQRNYYIDIEPAKELLYRYRIVCKTPYHIYIINQMLENSYVVQSNNLRNILLHYKSTSFALS